MDDSLNVKVGDIFYASWGYEQTNVDFVKVVGFSASGKSAKIVKIGQKIVESIAYMAEKVLPDPDNIVGKESMVRIKNYKDEPELRGTFYPMKDHPEYKRSEFFWKHDGEPVYQSHYA